MSEFNLTIDTDGAAFHPDSGYVPEEAEEIARIMLRVGQRLARGEIQGSVQDINGNVCGSYELAR